MEPVADQDAQIDVSPGALIERVDSWVDGFVRLLPNIVVALILVFVVWFLARWIGKIIDRAASGRGRESLGDVLGSFARWVLFLLGVLLALTIVLPTLRPGDLVAGLGVSSIAIGFAFKDILQNWLAGILLLLRQPFEVGDQIVVDKFEGTVERIETRATMIRTYDNQRVVIPNSDIYTDAVLVRTAYEARRSEYDIGIGYGDDIEAACAVVLEALQLVEGVAADPAPEAIPWGLDASWVTIRARWWSAPDRATVVAVTGRVLPAVKSALEAAGIDLPFETSVQLFHDQTEELDGLRGRQREGWPAPRGERPPRPARLAKAEGE